jgi:hypothetical protein
MGSYLPTGTWTDDANQDDAGRVGYAVRMEHDLGRGKKVEQTKHQAALTGTQQPAADSPPA